MRYRLFLVLLTFNYILSACDSAGFTDSDPDSFSFSAANDQLTNVQVTSSVITVSGIDTEVDVSISGGDYSVNGGAFTSVAGNVTDGDSVRVRGTSSTEFSASVDVTLTIGDESATFTITTADQDISPAAFTFIDITDAPLSTVTTSEAITITDINDETAIMIVGGEYSIDGGGFTDTDGTVTNGQMVTVRATSANAVLTETNVTLSVGGVSDVFTITTLDDTQPPVATVEFPPPSSMTEGATVTVRGTAIDGETSVSSVQVNGIDVTDTSDDSSFATWSVSVPLMDGDNTIIVAVTDAESNTDSTASVQVRRDATLADFPNGDNSFVVPVSMAIDYARNRAIIGDASGGRLFTMDLTSGQRDRLPDSAIGDEAITFSRPEGLLVDAENDLMWVADMETDAVYMVDLVDGTRTLLSSSSIPDDVVPFVSPREMLVNPTDDEELIIADGSGGLKAMNIITGARRVYSNEPIPDENNPFGSAEGVVADIERNRLLVADCGVPNYVVDINLDTQVRTYLSSNDGIPNSDSPNFVNIRTLVLDEARGRVIVNNPLNASGSELIAVDLETGVRSEFNSSTVPDTINAPIETEEVFFDGNLGYAFWLDSTLRAVIAVDIVTGERVIVTRGTTFEVEL